MSEQASPPAAGGAVAAQPEAAALAELQTRLDQLRGSGPFGEKHMSEVAFSRELRAWSQRFEEVGEQLRAKISSKYQTTAFLAGFGLAILAVQVALPWQATKVPCLLPWSTALMVAASVLYVAGMYRIDALTMPKRFWEEEQSGWYTYLPLWWLVSQTGTRAWRSIFRGVRRLRGLPDGAKPSGRGPLTHKRLRSQAGYATDEELWQLHDRMVFDWLGLTMLGLFAAAVSFGLLLLPVDPIEKPVETLDAVIKPTFWACAVVFAAAGAYLLVRGLLAWWLFPLPCRLKD